MRSNYKQDLTKLHELQNAKKVAITYRLSLTHIFVSFDDTMLVDNVAYVAVPDRIFAVDLNPNYLGWSVVDWKDSESYTVLDAGVISIKQLNDAERQLNLATDSSERRYIYNKRIFETTDSARYLVDIATHYQCEVFSAEKLNMSTADYGRGSKYNQLVNNQWNRHICYNQFHKYCDRIGIKFFTVVANYSSFVGNLSFRETQLPDMCLASVELGRRAYEFYHQYVLEDKSHQPNIMFDSSSKVKDRIVQSLEELGYAIEFEDIKSLYQIIKTRDLKYRVPLEDSILTAVCSKRSIKSAVHVYSSA